MPARNVRNVGIIAHIDAGKTTVSERILYYSRKEHRLGEVDDGTATMDWLPEEQRRGISITSAATSLSWGDAEIHLIDTPGHVDFTSEVERSLRVLDGAVGVFCGCAGVQAQTETVWRQADRYGIPRIAFVNKLDRTGADFFRVIDAIGRRLGVRPVAIQIPIGAESAFEGVVDLLTRRAFYFDAESLGARVIETDVPSDLVPAMELWRDRLVEAAADFDGSVLEHYIAGRDVDTTAVLRALRTGTISRKIVPVLGGAALRNRGIQPLLDAIRDFLPAPVEVGDLVGTDPRTGEPLSRPRIADAPLAALAFKTTAGAHGDLVVLRLYCGRLRPGDVVTNGRTGRPDRVQHLYELHANHREAIGVAEAGDIVGVLGFRDVSTGDSVYESHHPILIEPPRFPDTVLSVAVEPIHTRDRDKMVHALQRFCREDPTLRVVEDRDGGQILLSGMGELHLEVVCHRLRDDESLPVRVGRPRVAYRQTIAGTARAEGVFDRLVGDRRQYARVEVELRPAGTDDDGSVAYEVERDRIPLEFRDAIIDAVRSALRTGGGLGLTLVHAMARVVGGDARAGESTAAAFASAASKAVDLAIDAAGAVVLEPVLRLAVEVPDEFFGVVSSDLSQRRAELGESELVGDIRTIRGTVPLAEVFGYSTALRTLTHGRGAVSLEPDSYRPAPSRLVRRILGIDSPPE
jgi:elongation factor G